MISTKPINLYAFQFRPRRVLILPIFRLVGAYYDNDMLIAAIIIQL